MPAAHGRRYGFSPWNTHPEKRPMHQPHQHTPDDVRQGATISASDGASWCKSIAPDGSNALASPAPRAAGPEATEDGSQTGGEELHANHSIDCARTSPSQPRIQQRERLRDENKRLHQPSCRMNDAEYQLLARAAATCHMSIAGFLARSALDAAHDLGRTAADIAGEREMLHELFALRRHLGQLGNDLNQVAKALNSGADASQAEAVLATVQRAAKRVDAFTQHHLDNRTAG